jgi:hypothetical protein
MFSKNGECITDSVVLCSNTHTAREGLVGGKDREEVDGRRGFRQHFIIN